MKLILATVAMICMCSMALASEAFSLGAAASPDAEVSTNIPVVVCAERLKSWTVSIAFESCATNEVLVAIGKDADTDGNLSEDEADVVFCCDCGNWYRADLRTAETAVAESETLVIGKRDFNPEWNLAKIVRRGLGVIDMPIMQTIKIQIHRHCLLADEQTCIFKNGMSMEMEFSEPTSSATGFHAANRVG